MRSNYSEVQEDTEYGSVQQVAALQANNDRARLVSKGVKGLVACMATLMVMGVVVSHFNQFGSSGFVNFKKASKDNFDSLGRFIIQDYDTKPGFASFLPGIGGKYGIPMWAFYLNRGQAIASFGIESKDNPMYEFESATKAYQQTPLTGFRTFMKGSANGKPFNYQPFMEKTTGKSSRDMYVGMNEVEIEDYNAELGIQTNVLYFNLVEEAFPGLVRTVTVTNRGKQPLSVEMLDGPVKFLPYGVTDAPMKNLPTTEEAWFAVYNMDVDQTLPWYKETSSTADSDIVTPVIKGNYAFSWVKGSDSRLPFIADPDVVFGQDKTLFEPVEFLAADSLEAVVNATQAPVARTAVALAASAFVLKPGENITVHSLYGQAQDLDALVNHVVPTAMAKGYLDTKSDRAHELLDEITSPVATSTANGIFDAFVRYNFLDNVMRGGYPLLLGSSPETQKVYHIYSRIHGDLERDYNPFYIQPTYFSQGPGNFRDVNQNRRCEVMFQPDMGPSNALNFYTLIQADGYNPLTVASPTWFLSPDDQDALVAAAVAPGDAESEAQLRAVLSSQTLAPGDIAMFAYGNTALLLDADALLDLAADKAQEYFNAAFGEGYWSDHWSYNLDLISSYLAVFPDMEADMLWNNTVKTFISPVYVLPRSIKYVLLGDTPRQVAPVVYKQPGGATGYWPCNTWQCRAGDEASGGVAWESYEMTLAAKVLLLGTVKFAMLDPQGMGVEMEGGKPGWLDAMNGLPSLFGSTTPEAFELYRTLDYLNSATRFGVDTAVPEELDTLLQAIRTNLAALNDGTLDDFNYWDQTRTALETYRASLTSTFSGNEVAWSAADLGSLLTSMLARMDVGIARAEALGNGTTPTYFSWEPTAYAVLNSTYSGSPNIAVQGMAPTVLPMYLEGSVRHFKVMKSREEKLAKYASVAVSGVKDEVLGMYKICENLDAQDPATGRIKSFPAGWLEHESVWMHMSYKFYLELLRGGLYDQFWAEAQVGMTPWMDVEVYGRSPLEASSFIASSAFLDKKAWGQGFVARLSGTTAEFTSMWNLMFAGPQPFTVDETSGELSLSLAPALPAFLFAEATQAASFTFLGAVNVTYVNPEMKDTWSPDLEATSVAFELDGQAVSVAGGVLGDAHARAVRDRRVAALTVTFGAASR